jgi:hypothetical protein
LTQILKRRTWVMRRPRLEMEVIFTRTTGFRLALMLDQGDEPTARLLHLYALARDRDLPADDPCPRTFRGSRTSGARAGAWSVAGDAALPELDAGVALGAVERMLS